MISRLNQYAQRTQMIALRYVYWLGALIRNRILYRRHVGSFPFGTESPGQCMVVTPPDGLPGGVVVHLHGMGDTVWAAMKDGVDVFPRRLGILLILPEIGRAPWCAETTLNDVADLLVRLRNSYSHLPIVLSGTSMGGTIALALLARPKALNCLDGVMVFSCTSRLDDLFVHTTSAEVRAALIKATDGDQSVLAQLSPDCAAIDHPIPVSLAFNPGDSVVPPAPLEHTAALLYEKGFPLRIAPMIRPPGHYRPIVKEIVDAYEWVMDQRGDVIDIHW
jgi:hypothetical protein